MKKKTFILRIKNYLGVSDCPKFPLLHGSLLQLHPLRALLVCPSGFVGAGSSPGFGE